MGLLLSTCIGAGVLICALKWFAATGALRAPKNAHPFNYQARAARTGGQAELIFVGDSTCLMGVNALELSKQLPGHPKTLNLGLVNMFGPNVYARLLGTFQSNNPKPHFVIMLLAPTTLVVQRSADGGMAEWMEVETEVAQESTTEEWVASFRSDPLAVRLLRTKARGVVELPIQTDGAEVFGFHSVFEAFQTRRRGGFPDGGMYRNAGARESRSLWHLDLVWAEQARMFRAQISDGSKLLIGLTPLPESIVTTEDVGQFDDLLHAWQSVIRPHAVMSNLPSTLPNHFFGKSGHLNVAGQEQFTRALAAELAVFFEGAAQAD